MSREMSNQRTPRNIRYQRYLILVIIFLFNIFFFFSFFLFKLDRSNSSTCALPFPQVQRFIETARPYLDSGETWLRATSFCSLLAFNQHFYYLGGRVIALVVVSWEFPKVGSQFNQLKQWGDCYSIISRRRPRHQLPVLGVRYLSNLGLDASRWWPGQAWWLESSSIAGSG